MGWLIQSLIMAYQRWLSPLKGFSCAHRILHGGSSCSGYALQVLESDGPLRLLPLMHRRFHDCAKANASLRAQRASAWIGATAISNATYPSPVPTPEPAPEPPEESATGVDWYGDRRAADRYARSGFDDEGERAVRCCAEHTIVPPWGCCWRI
jgi:putative component of membrane protein insertase Oxa1/YidC/SpoIIIJ protein YidD